MDYSVSSVIRMLIIDVGRASGSELGQSLIGKALIRSVFGQNCQEVVVIHRDTFLFSSI
jgi:hypothetical protein